MVISMQAIPSVDLLPAADAGSLLQGNANDLFHRVHDPLMSEQAFATFLQWTTPTDCC
jgi:hypothetical protein